MKKIILILLVTIFSYAESTFSDPQPTFDDPRKLVVRLYDADVEKTNHTCYSKTYIDRCTYIYWSIHISLIYTYKDTHINKHEYPI